MKEKKGPVSVFPPNHRPDQSLGRRTSTIYDAAGRAVASVNALGYRTTNIYNAASQGVGAITALGQRMTQVYDSAGRGGQ